MASHINAESLDVWLAGEEYVEKDASFFNTLKKDDVFNNGMNLNEYEDLRRDEKMLLSILRYKRYIEYGFRGGLKWVDGSINIMNGANFSVSSFLTCSLIPVGNERSYVLKQTCSFQRQVCVSTYDLLLPPGIKGLNPNVKFLNPYQANVTPVQKPAK